MMKIFNLLILFSLFIHSTFANVDWDKYEKIMNKQEQKVNQRKEVLDIFKAPAKELNLLNKSVETDDKINSSLESFKSFILKRDGKEAAMSLGNDGPHGGDSYGSEFSAIGYELALSLASHEQSHIDTRKFLRAVENVVVYSDKASRVTLNSQIVDALNFPNDNIILVNRERWRKMNLIQKVRLVFHEYLGIINAERDIYKLSVRFNEFFFAEAKRLRDRGIQNHYGFSKASQPLSFTGSTCDESSPKVEKAIASAIKESRSRCLYSDSGECTDYIIEFEEVLSSFGIRRCYVTAIMK